MKNKKKQKNKKKSKNKIEIHRTTEKRTPKQLKIKTTKRRQEAQPHTRKPDPSSRPSPLKKESKTRISEGQQQPQPNTGMIQKIAVN